MTTHSASDLQSGALLLERVKLGTGGTCVNDPCSRMGRYRIRIAGHYVKGPTPVQRYAYLCPKCGAAEIALWSELTGRAAVGELAA